LGEHEGRSASWSHNEQGNYKYDQEKDVSKATDKLQWCKSSPRKDIAGDRNG